MGENEAKIVKELMKWQLIASGKNLGLKDRLLRKEKWVAHS